jgi:hypothetical protein
MRRKVRAQQGEMGVREVEREVGQEGKVDSWVSRGM